MPNRFIAENDLVLNIIMEHACKNNRQEIALLLDKKKRLRSGTPFLLTLGVTTVRVPNDTNELFGWAIFGNRVRVNFNGHFTDEVTQSCGLRQRDLLSPLLFNLAL
jgi:hypothetical protein